MTRILALALLVLAWTAPSATGRAGPITDEDIGSVMARTALIDLGVGGSPAADDYEIAGAVLWAASGLRPSDAETARLAAAAAWSSGDGDLLLEATRAIVRADPDDTVAQLRLISANINTRQTIEERLNAFERFLGPAGRSLDPSVRSRLALDAALLMRESGDVEGFQRRLNQAVDLDGTNKDAVSLAARTFTGPDSSATEVAAWQVRLLYADPLDPNVHMTIGRICAAQGAIEPAQRFLGNASQLLRIELGDLPPQVREQQLALQWQLRGSEALLSALNTPLADMRRDAAARIEARREAGEPTDDIRRPDQIRYDSGIERIRLLAAFVAGDEDTITASLRDMALTTGETLAALGENLGTAPERDRPRVLLEMIRVFAEFQTMRAIVQREHEQIEPQIRELFGNSPAATELLEPLRAWVAYGRGDYTLALDLVGTPRPGTSDDFLVALASEKLGDHETAAPIFTRYARARSLDAYGGLARHRLRELGREGGIVSTPGRQLASALGRVPGWMDRMITDPRTFMLLQAETGASTVGPHEPMLVRITLRNAAPIPLGLGSSRPIGSRMLIAPRPISRIADFAGSPTPKVLELDRRLRLEPLAELRVVIEPDSAYTSWLREVNAFISLRDRYRVIQSFVPSARGGLINAPLALVTESPIVQRVTLELAREPVEGLIERAKSDDPDDLRAALVATMARTIDPPDGLELTGEQRRALADAWAERFVASDDAERAYILLKLPHAGQSPEFERFDRVALETFVADSVRRAGVDTRVLIAAMLTRVREPDSPVFELAAMDGDQRLNRLASLARGRLRAGRPSFATAGPGASGLAPPGESADPGLLP